MRLKRAIGRKSLVLLTINAIMGTGIFFLPALGAAYAGPASIFAWLIMAMAAIAMSVYFAELLSMFPKSGGIYEYTKKAFGEFSGFLVGWTSWIVSSITISMLIVGSVSYIVPGAGVLERMVISLSTILIFNYISYRGIHYSTKMLVFFGIVTIFSLLLIISGGISNIDISNFSTSFSIQIPLLLLSVYFISETFFGWETTTYLAEEAKNPRALPRTLVLATVMISIISILLVFVALANPAWQQFSGHPAPFVFLSEQYFGSQFSLVYALLVFVPLVGTAASWIVSSPRLLYAMARDNVLVPRFKKVHKKYNTPHQAIFFQAMLTIAITIVGFSDYVTLLSLLVPLVVIMYSVVLLSVTRLRVKQPDTHRPFSAPFPKLGPVILVAFNVVLLYIWLSSIPTAVDIFLLDVFFVLFGIPLYLLIKLRTDEKFTEKFYDSISVMWDTLFSVWYGKNEINKVINKLKLKEGVRVLDFGAGSGITTMAIAKRIGRHGLVVAIDLSEKQLIKAVKKSRAIRHPNIIFMKTSKINFKKNSFDAVTMVNVLEHLKYPEKELKTIFRYLRKGGRFSVLSFGKSFGIPAPEHIASKNSIDELFRKSGVKKINIRKENKRFSEYWYIWGRK